jgi:hypothetical protein
MSLGQGQEGQPISQGARISLSGPEDFSLDAGDNPKLWLNNEHRLYQGDAVEVDPATAQTLNCDSRILNAEPGFSLLWSICTTIYDVTHNRAVGSKVDNADGGLGQANPTISVGKITTPTQFRVRVWANQAFQAAAPPAADW